MKDFKEFLQQLVAVDDLGGAVAYLREIPPAGFEDPDTWNNDAILLASRWTNYQKEMGQGTVSFEYLARTRNQISLALLNLIEGLPEGLPVPEQPPQAAPRGVSELKLKNRLFGLVVLGKVFVIGFVLLLWQSGGFSMAEMTSTIGLLVPIFATYLGLLFKDQVDRRRAIQHPDQRVTRRFERISYLTLIAYVLILFGVINWQGKGAISFPVMTNLLALAESGLGIFVSQLFFAIFKKEGD